MDVSLANSRWEGSAVNGVELCRLLKADPRTAAIPVMLATAHAMRGDAESLIAESGADDYVAKPIVDHAAFVGTGSRLRRGGGMNAPPRSSILVVEDDPFFQRVLEQAARPPRATRSMTAADGREGMKVDRDAASPTS